MNLAREWAAFAGALFTLMGASLAAAAPRNAEDALSWERQWRQAVGAPDPVEDAAPRRRVWALAYRLGGLFFICAGLALLWCAATGRGSFATRGGARDALSGGIFFCVSGAALAFNAWSRSGRRGPRFLEGILLPDDAPPALGERVALACRRAIIALFLAFGARLLFVGLR